MAPGSSPAETETTPSFTPPISRQQAAATIPLGEDTARLTAAAAATATAGGGLGLTAPTAPQGPLDQVPTAPETGEMPELSLDDPPAMPEAGEMPQLSLDEPPAAPEAGEMPELSLDEPPAAPEAGEMPAMAPPAPDLSLSLTMPGEDAPVEPTLPEARSGPDAAMEAPALDAPPLEPVWIVSGDTDQVQLDKAALRELIRQGEISSDTYLTPSWGGDPLSAGDVPQLQRYFRLKTGGPSPAEGKENVPPAISPAAAAQAGNCTIHPAREVEHVCTVCHTLFCALCVGEKAFGTTKVNWCLRCDDRCIPYEGIRNVVPFWREIPRLIAYPLRGWGTFMILCCAALSFFGAILPGPGKILYFFVLAYQLHILRESAHGNKKLPDWPDTSDFWQISMRGLKAVVVSLIAWLPVIAFNMVLFSQVLGSLEETLDGAMAVEASSSAVTADEGEGQAIPPVGANGEIDVERYLDENDEFDFERFQADMATNEGGDALAADLAQLAKAGALFLGGNIVLVLLVLLYYPMCLMIAAIFNTILPALNPVLIVRCIGRIKADYVMALVFCGVLTIGGAIAQMVLSIIPLAGAILASLVGAYIMFIQMHVLGWTAHQGWDRLNWDIKI